MRWFDQVLRWRARLGLAPAVGPHIVHLNLDADDLGRWPDLAAEYRDAAAIINEASDLGASVIVFDIVFGRGSREDARPILEAIERAKSTNCSVVLAEFLQGPLDMKRSFPFGERHRPAGLANVQSDPDGVLRRYAFVQRGPDGLEPSLALAAYLAWRKLDWDKVSRSPETGIVSWTELSADYSALKSRQARAVPALLNFRTDWDASGQGSFLNYTRAQLQSLHSTRQSSPDPGASPLENRVVIVSSVAAGVGDLGVTPLGINQPKALVHSTALDDLIQDRSIMWVSPLVEAIAFGFLLPLVWVMSLSRGTGSLLLWWAAGTLAIFGVGTALIIGTGYIIGSVAIGSLWTVIVIGELARRALTSPSAPPRDLHEKAAPAENKEPERKKPTYDVFLAHNSQDKPAVLAVAAALRRRGLSPWVDVEQIPPGRWLQDVLQSAILEVRATAIFLGPAGLGRWQALELRAFVSQCIERHIPVIPVLLPGVVEIPQSLVFLRELNCVSFRRSTNEVEALDRLVWGITGRRPAKRR
jgi:CHASE2 domain-containing sensor protein